MMEMLNRAIENARDFEGFMDKITADEKRVIQNFLTRGATPEATGLPIGQDRQPGENRAAHRARLKAERRTRKVPA